jgi:hypothetical protein
MKNLKLFLKANKVSLFVLIAFICLISAGTTYVIKQNTKDQMFPVNFYLETDQISDDQCLVYIVDDYGEIVLIDGNCYLHCSAAQRHKMHEFIGTFEGSSDLNQLSVDYWLAMENIERTGLVE